MEHCELGIVLAQLAARPLLHWETTLLAAQLERALAAKPDIPAIQRLLLDFEKADAVPHGRQRCQASVDAAKALLQKHQEDQVQDTKNGLSQALKALQDASDPAWKANLKNWDECLRVGSAELLPAEAPLYKRLETLSRDVNVYKKKILEQPDLYANDGKVLLKQAEETFHAARVKSTESFFLEAILFLKPDKAKSKISKRAEQLKNCNAVLPLIWEKARSICPELPCQSSSAEKLRPASLLHAWSVT
ncbi:unnamed protein product [Symbiodinium necroappetens]|uniref:Uncharacterized protein n=1 Tax=Symbiodinium necroappetens TaxID=1628268 RepID=A0A813C689_9DINO|nr:unnamed protein product [Symbiodinium necroappetens]